MFHGFSDSRWTTARLAKVIEAQFGVRYDHDHVGRLMQRLGLREPKRRANPVMKTLAAYATARYSPNTDLNRSEISPVVA